MYGATMCRGGSSFLSSPLLSSPLPSTRGSPRSTESLLHDRGIRLVRGWPRAPRPSPLGPLSCSGAVPASREPPTAAPSSKQRRAAVQLSRDTARASNRRSLARSFAPFRSLRWDVAAARTGRTRRRVASREVNAKTWSGKSSRPSPGEGTSSGLSSRRVRALRRRRKGEARGTRCLGNARRRAVPRSNRFFRGRRKKPSHVSLVRSNERYGIRKFNVALTVRQVLYIRGTEDRKGGRAEAR